MTFVLKIQTLDRFTRLKRIYFMHVSWVSLEINESIKIPGNFIIEPRDNSVFILFENVDTWHVAFRNKLEDTYYIYYCVFFPTYNVLLCYESNLKFFFTLLQVIKWKIEGLNKLWSYKICNWIFSFNLDIVFFISIYVDIYIN